MRISRRLVFLICFLALGLASPLHTQSSGRIAGRVTDETGGALPGVTVQLQSAGGSPRETITSANGDYAFDEVAAGTYELSFKLINFASLARRDVRVGGIRGAGPSGVENVRIDA